MRNSIFEHPAAILLIDSRNNALLRVYNLDNAHYVYRIKWVRGT